MALVWILALAVAMSVLAGVLFAAPRWFARSLHRHRMWQFRDEVVDRILDGDLPGDHPAVIQLVDDAECGIVACSKQTLLRVLAFHMLTHSLTHEAHSAARARYRDKPTEDLTPGEEKLINEYRERYHLLVTGALLLGSWVGIAMVLAWTVRLLVGTTAERRTRRVRPRRGARWLVTRLWQVLIEATDSVARHTRLGRAAGKAVDELPLYGMVAASM